MLLLLLSCLQFILIENKLCQCHHGKTTTVSAAAAVFAESTSAPRCSAVAARVAAGATDIKLFISHPPGV